MQMAHVLYMLLLLAFNLDIFLQAEITLQIGEIQKWIDVQQKAKVMHFTCLCFEGLCMILLYKQDEITWLCSKCVFDIWT